MQDDNTLTGKDAEEFFWREYKRHNEERAKELADAKAAAALHIRARTLARLESMLSLIEDSGHGA